MYKLPKQSRSFYTKTDTEPYIGVIEKENNYYVISELAENLGEAKQRLVTLFKKEEVRGTIKIYKAKFRTRSKIIDFHNEQFEDGDRPLFKKMRENVPKFLRRNCVSIGVAYLAPLPPPCLTRNNTDKFIENIEFRRS